MIKILNKDLQITVEEEKQPECTPKSSRPLENIALAILNSHEESDKLKKI